VIPSCFFFFKKKDQSPASSSFHWMTQITKSTVTAPTELSASQEAGTIQDPCCISALYCLLFIFRICTTMLTLYTNKKTLVISRWLTCHVLAPLLLFWVACIVQCRATKAGKFIQINMGSK
jgi:hypothetical protein